ncbi:hypothetical protein A3I40_02865 [Candidatus Uhrbacteria bacterium RIFCSPLOWO2_02_FULL_48_12]|uniref:Uncharacterized protein n=1 Tax=Candidatus Uhrbacteria bacterium RIFCSPLOWO2_02_FULL_48_12 TaxID=1802407 RepID=A0A1F7VAS7_9BACT|nr:MAG: hypothetical protein A3I40_02865 [Candidatus Uhrbacteria bacterium RIFCSPLOWO2_02_FULL_48_12]
MNKHPKKFLSKFVRQPHIRLFVFLVALFLVLIGAIKYTAERLGHDTAPAPWRENLYQSDLNLKSVYETKTAAIVRKFAAENSSGAAGQRLGAIVKARQDLLDLTVPPEYKDLHLQLVIALTQLEAGYQGDADKLSKGQTMLSEAIKSQAWLKF